MQLLVIYQRYHAVAVKAFVIKGWHLRSFSIITTDMVESSSASEIRIINAFRATKTMLEMAWMQVEQNLVAGDRCGLDSNLY